MSGDLFSLRAHHQMLTLSQHTNYNAKPGLQWIGSLSLHLSLNRYKSSALLCSGHSRQLRS